jgi:hypothetical protein
MRIRDRRARSLPVLAAAGLAAVAALLGGCGTAPASSQPPRTSGTTPAAGTRAEALALAQRLVSQLVLPSGARTTHLPSLPPPLRPPWGSVAGSADTGRLITAPQTIAAVRAFMLAHPPSGAGTTATGRQTGPAGLIAQDVYFDLRTLPPGINDASLAITLVPQPNRATLIAAYAHVTWFPARTATEHLTVADFRSVTISAFVLSPRPHHATRTFTSPSVIADLAGFLNGLRAAPDVTTSCPGHATSYQLRFSPVPGRVREVVALAAGCGSIQVSTDAILQPSLSDPHNAMTAMAGKLLHLSTAA